MTTKPISCAAISAVTNAPIQATSWEVIDPAPHDTLEATLQQLTEQVSSGNSYPVSLFLPLYRAIQQRLDGQAVEVQP